MKIVVIGGSGLIGTKLVSKLRQRGHEVVAASPSTGVNTITGEGLAEALAGAQVVVDVANSPSLEDKAVLEFFETSGRNILAAEAAAGVGHHVALSVVGTDRLLESGYFRAKMAQENLIKASEDSLHDRPGHAVLRVRRRHRRNRHRRANGSLAARADAAHRGGRRGCRAGRCRARGAGEWNGRGGGSRSACLWTKPSGDSCAPTDDERQVVTDVHARYYGLDDRPIADAGRRRATWPNSSRHLAQAIHGVAFSGIKAVG